MLKHTTTSPLRRQGSKLHAYSQNLGPCLRRDDVVVFIYLR